MKGKVLKKVLVIDSGVSKHPKLNEINICTTGFRNQNTLDDIYDNIGHGTAVVSLISKGVSVDELEVYVIRLFNNFFECTITKLIECLEYVVENNIYDVINMSFGITASDEYDQIEKLRILCEIIKMKGTIIVAAFDNDGAISYPAFFKEVIGVDTSYKSNKRTEYEYIHNSCVNILGYGKNQKVAWNNPLYTIIEGNSFACANITNVIINMIIQGVEKNEINDKLEEQAISVNSYKEYSLPPDRPKWLKGKRFIIFPFNKEMHSIYAYEKLLDFEIVAAYDLKYKALIGKNISDIITYRNVQNRVIKNYDDIKWDSDEFDGIIVGHIAELSVVCKRNLMEEIIKKCITYKKKIYAFDDISTYILNDRDKDYFEYNTYFPRITYENIPKGRFGKLFNIQIPVLAVIGTSSSQGKFTVQLLLRQKLQNAGYRVGQIGTEPSACCFDMDFTFPYGYSSTVYTTGYHNILLLNEAIHDIEMKGSDICVVGTQTNTALYGYSNLKNIPLFQADILYGTMPDAFFLVVNAHDEIDYIIRTMRSTEELIESKCIGIIVYPMMQKRTIGTLYKKIHISDSNYKAFKEELSKRVNIPIMSFNTVMNTEILVELITDYFSEPRDIFE